MPEGTQVADAASASSGGFGFAGAPGDTLTEDAILDGPAPGETAVVDQPEATPAADPAEGADPALEADPAADPAKPAAAQPDADAVPGALPTEVTALFKDPLLKSNPALAAAMPKIQSAFDTLRTIRDVFPTTRAVREFAETFPGGLEEAKAAAMRASLLDEGSDQFYGTPEEQKALAGEQFDDNPQAFTSMFLQQAALLNERDPEGYARMTESVFRSQFEGAYFDRQLYAIGQALKSGDIDKLKSYTAWLVAEADKRGLVYNDKRGQEHPALAEAEKIRKEGLAAKSEAENLQVQNFHGGISATAEAAAKKEIAARLATSLKDSAFSDTGKAKISKQIYDEVGAALAADRNLQRQIRTIREEGFRTNAKPAAAKQITDLLTGRAKRLIEATAKKVIAERTAELIASNKQTNSKRDAAASRTEVGTGGAAPRIRTKKLEPKDVQNLSDDEILDL